MLPKKTICLPPVQFIVLCKMIHVQLFLRPIRNRMEFANDIYTAHSGKSDDLPGVSEFARTIELMESLTRRRLLFALKKSREWPK